jgi:hypothetical protein
MDIADIIMIGQTKQHHLSQKSVLPSGSDHAVFAALMH